MSLYTAYRIIRTGHIFEIYSYEKTPIIAERAEKGSKTKNNIERVEEYRQTASRRAREKLRRLVNANFSSESLFITLTFAENIQDIEYANTEFKKFIQRLKRKYKGHDIKYVSVIEFQKRGAIHYHMLCNLPIEWRDRDDLRSQERKIADIWENGFVDIEKSKTWQDCDNIGAYLLKYMMKDLSDNRLAGKQTYLHSRNLIEPEVILGDDVRVWLDTLAGWYPTFTSSYENDFWGQVKYWEYNLKRGENA